MESEPQNWREYGKRGVSVQKCAAKNRRRKIESRQVLAEGAVIHCKGYRLHPRNRMPSVHRQAAPQNAARKREGCSSLRSISGQQKSCTQCSGVSRDSGMGNKELSTNLPLSNLFVAEALGFLSITSGAMKKGAKRRGASKAGREDAVAERQNDEVVAESLEESQQPKEEAEAKEEENQENGEEDKEVDEVKDEEVEGEDKKKKKPVRGGGKRKRATKKGIEVKARVSKPQEEPEYFEDEPQLVPFKGANKILHVPAVVAVESPFPPSDKIGITSVQREVEEIIPMKTMEMDWLPYIPVDKSRQVDSMDFQIFVLGCTRRSRAALRHMKEDLVKKYEYCLPYFYQPFTEDELEQNTEVQIMFPSEPPVVCEFDWELDELEEFVDKLIEDEALASEQKDELKASGAVFNSIEYVKEQVRAAKKANRNPKEFLKFEITDPPTSLSLTSSSPKH
ncbi:hypothetical protein Bca52824_050756 [Brassica carinata]|uniref:Uncharacterized protein n=1 Tax=Brassica carinata TaxID=52824 RepID=A0A8X7R0K0_BRACI|nr:hypothetical protein Bca52824_050756 [Brassica carinata]